MELAGVVVSWTTPPGRGRFGFESEVRLSLANSLLPCMLRITSPTLEEHVWPTREGQWLQASSVEVDETLLYGRVSAEFVVLLGDVEAQCAPVTTQWYDLPTVDRIVGFRRQRETNALTVLLAERSAAVTCVDPNKSKELLAIGVGGYVRLSNVKVKGDKIFVTAGSDVHSVPPPAPPPPVPLSPPPRVHLSNAKWLCLGCARLNYPSKTVCGHCRMTRKEGPMPKDLRGFTFDPVEPYVFKRMEQWMCCECRWRDNFYTRDTCFRCGATRTEEERKQRKKRAKNND